MVRPPCHRRDVPWKVRNRTAIGPCGADPGCLSEGHTNTNLKRGLHRPVPRRDVETAAGLWTDAQIKRQHARSQQCSATGRNGILSLLQRAGTLPAFCYMEEVRESQILHDLTSTWNLKNTKTQKPNKFTGNREHSGGCQRQGWGAETGQTGKVVKSANFQVQKVLGTNGHYSWQHCGVDREAAKRVSLTSFYQEKNNSRILKVRDVN